MCMYVRVNDKKYTNNATSKHVIRLEFRKIYITQFKKCSGNSFASTCGVIILFWIEKRNSAMHHIVFNKEA